MHMSIGPGLLGTEAKLEHNLSVFFLFVVAVLKFGFLFVTR